MPPNDGRDYGEGHYGRSRHHGRRDDDREYDRRSRRYSPPRERRRGDERERHSSWRRGEDRYNGENTMEDKDFLIDRMKERDEIECNIWQKSPKRTEDSLAELLAEYTRKRDANQAAKKPETSINQESNANESFESDEDEWVEKEVVMQPKEASDEEEDNLKAFGPNPATADMLRDSIKIDNKILTDAMMPGEGASYLQYVQQDKRIPRRGEVGLDANTIQRYEDAGYVMSGSRNKRMNAIRLRKEMQVYSADSKRRLLEFKYKQKVQKESDTISHFRQMLQEKMQQG